MMEKKVQLKEQEIVGQEVVLSDIYPKTDTSSVEDVVTGASLDVKLDRIVELINDKLTRVVNSVNARTGVVVLDADDVGLGNVDNISFNTIKEWVIETIEQYFDNKHLLFFSDEISLSDRVNQNDLSLADTPFFVETWNASEDEYRSAIGYISIDPNHEELSYKYKLINTVKETDESLVYEKGKLHVKIANWNDNVLTLRNNGLMVARENTGHTICCLRSIYQTIDGLDGIRNQRVTSFLLETDDKYNDSNLLDVRIKINDTSIYNETTGLETFKLNDNLLSDSILMNLENGHGFIFIENSYDLKDLMSTEHMTKALLCHQPLIGQLKKSSATDFLSLYLYPISPYVSWGLTNDKNYQKKSTDGENTVMTDFLDTETRIATTANYSNIQVLSHPDQYDMSMYQTGKSTYKTISPLTNGIDIHKMSQVFNPSGIDTLYDSANVSKRQGGMFIPTDASISSIPYRDYGLTEDTNSTDCHSNKVTNWYANTPYYLTAEQVASHDGYLNEPVFLGVNLVKGISPTSTEDTQTYLPLSGLKIMDPYETTFFRHGDTRARIDWGTIGLNGDCQEDKDAFLSKEKKNRNISFFRNTGGLMVNCGKGLGIIPEKIPRSGEEYNSEGKVTVRLGKGLMFDEYDRITYNPNELNITTPATAVAAPASTYLQGTIIKGLQDTESSIKYYLYPTAVYNDNMIESMNTITLGDGLRIHLDQSDLQTMIWNSLTIIQLSYYENKTYSNGNIKVSDYLNTAYTLKQLEDNYIPQFLSRLEEHGYIGSAYNDIVDVQNVPGATYSNVDVVHSLSIHRLYLDEINAGKTLATNAKQMTVDQLIQNYATRHEMEAGEYQLYSTNEEVIQNYTQDIKTIDYTKSNLPIFYGLNVAQTTFINTAFNVIRAIKKALLDEEQFSQLQTDATLSDASYTSNKSLTIQLDDEEYTSRMDCSGYIAFILQAMGYQTKDFVTSLLLAENEEDRAKILESDGTTVSEHFIYNYNPTLDDLRLGDIVVRNKHMWIYGMNNVQLDHETEEPMQFDLKGFDFGSNEHILSLMNHVEALLAGKYMDDENPTTANRSAKNLLFNIKEATIWPDDEDITDSISLVIRYVGAGG